MKILLLEDDELFAETLEDFLDDNDFSVDIAKNGKEALGLNYESNYDLYLLDINVPEINGLELLKDLRESGDTTPAIYLTSYKDKETLQQGFLNGADDYLKKPVDLDELLLRIKSILNRVGKIKKDVIFEDGYIFESAMKRVMKNGVDTNTPMKVIELLELFLENNSSVITKEMIVNRLWSIDEEYSEGSIRVYINHLKKIVGKDRVTNIKNVGYKFEL